MDFRGIFWAKCDTLLLWQSLIRSVKRLTSCAESKVFWCWFLPWNLFKISLYQFDQSWPSFESCYINEINSFIRKKPHFDIFLTHLLISMSDKTASASPHRDECLTSADCFRSDSELEVNFRIRFQYFTKHSSLKLVVCWFACGNGKIWRVSPNSCQDMKK